MARTDRRTRARRLRIVPSLVLLEGRALLSGGPILGTGSGTGGTGSIDVAQNNFYNFMLSPGATLGSENATPIAGDYGATQLETAYGVTALGSSNQGQGQTIGIVDVFSDSDVISDVNTYSAEYGLPQFNTTGGPTFTVDEPLGNPGASATSGGNDTSTETSLDVDMAHAMAPEANIVMVFVPGGTGTTNQQFYDSEFANILQGVDYAASQGASAVSVSYGITESSLGTSGGTAVAVTQSNTYLAPSVLPDTVVTVSTGDGSTTSFPATSPDVIAVGGTSLHLNSAKGRYGYETAWGGYPGAGAGGGGPSTDFPTPAYQYSNGVGTSTGNRLTPDVSMSADDVYATSLYDSYDNSDWTAAGGTSEASPLFAGVVALAQQQLVAQSDSTFNAFALDTDLYSLYSNATNYANDFHDVTIGTNGDVSSKGKTTVAGYSAVTGYDEATGIGSPNAANLVPMLSSLGNAIEGPITGGFGSGGLINSDSTLGTQGTGGQGFGGGLDADFVPLFLPSTNPTSGSTLVSSGIKDSKPTL